MQLTEKHSFINDTIFRLKVLVLTGNRFFKDMFSPVRKFKPDVQLMGEPVIAFSESDLWNLSDNKENQILTTGKIENLRIACKRLNGLEIKANEVFSFWKHIGNPNFGKGYVVGREIREGCIVPTIAGGLCQLSNALYDAALKANFQVIERHKHTQVIKGSLAEQDRDATVKWNYMDLRFRSGFDFRMDMELTSDKLIVSFKSKQKNTKTGDIHFNVRASDKLNDCYSCGNFGCFKHPDRSLVKQEIATTTFILDEKWPEFDNYLSAVVTNIDSFIIPFKKNIFTKARQYSWMAAQSNQTRTTTFQGIYRAIRLRYASGDNVFEQRIKLDKNIAMAAAKQIPLESTHLVISQNLLPFVFETGILGGRTFDVLMTRLPLEKLHERLDFAHSKHPESVTLNDFRASQYLIELENKALTKARKIITPHAEIAELFRNKVEKLSWQFTISSEKPVNGKKVLFPASSVGRKGAYEIRMLAKELNLDLVISGKAREHEKFWEGIKVKPFNGNYEEIALVLYPAYVEHQPRQLLNAISKGIPVIATAACGLEHSGNVTIVETGNFEQFRNEVYRQINNKR